jgi:hypothetical protein
VDIDEINNSASAACFSAACVLQGDRMHLATMWLGISGLALMAMLLARHVKGAIMIGGWKRLVLHEQFGASCQHQFVAQAAVELCRTGRCAMIAQQCTIIRMFWLAGQLTDVLCLLCCPVGILFTTFISWIPNHGASYLGAGSQIPGQAGLGQLYMYIRCIGAGWHKLCSAHAPGTAASGVPCSQQPWCCTVE